MTSAILNLSGSTKFGAIILYSHFPVEDMVQKSQSNMAAATY